MSIRRMLAAIFGVTLAAVLALSVTLAVVGARIAHAHEHARWSAEALALHLQLGIDAGRYMKEVHGLSAPRRASASRWVSASPRWSGSRRRPGSRAQERPPRR